MKLQGLETDGPFSVLSRENDGRPFLPEATYKSIPEVRAHPFRPGEIYLIGIADIVRSRNEFEEWADIVCPAA